jgi:hypothetical protein
LYVSRLNSGNAGCLLIGIFCLPVSSLNTRTVCKVRGLTLLLRVGTLWRFDDGLFFEVPPLASDAFLTTLHPILENVLQTICLKLQEDSGTGGFVILIWLEKPRNRMGRDLDCMADVLMGMMAVPIQNIDSVRKLLDTPSYIAPHPTPHLPSPLSRYHCITQQSV